MWDSTKREAAAGANSGEFSIKTIDRYHVELVSITVRYMIFYRYWDKHIGIIYTRYDSIYFSYRHSSRLDGSGGILPSGGKAAGAI